MGTDRTDLAQTQTASQAISRPQADLQPPDAQWHPVRAQDRYRLGVPAAGDGMRIGHDLLASSARLATTWHLGQGAPRTAEQTPRGRQDRLVGSSGGQHVSACGFWGAQTGPNPTD